MAKFNQSLVAKVEAEEKESRKQKKLRDESGIADEDVYIKERGAGDYAIALIKGILYFLFTILVFIGIVALINPESRELLFGLVPFLQ